jgi:ligand-binding sensor domain-containing protein
MNNAAKIISITLPVAVLILSGFLFRELYPQSGTDPKTASEIEFVRGMQAFAEGEDEVQPLNVYDNWTHFTVEDGLPSDKVNCVKADGKDIWIGTDKGMVLMQDDRIVEVFKTEDGLAHHNVVSLDIDKNTGDLWIGTMGGLNRYSAGRFELFNQFNSGMPNDVVYQVFCIEQYVWVATGGGAGCYNVYTRQWDIFTEQNAPMHEPWTYGVSGGDGKVFIAAWGGGIIEYELATGQMRDYVDPDGEMEIDLFPDDGVVHDITTGSSYSDGLLWVGTYFGMSRYDGARWKGYFDHDSGLASNFINFTLADGRAVWLCTDNGLSNFNGETWITYRPGKASGQGEVIITGKNKKETIYTNTTISHNFIWGMDVQDNVVWLATARGLSRGKASGSIMAKAEF